MTTTIRVRLRWADNRPDTITNVDANADEIQLFQEGRFYAFRDSGEVDGDNCLIYVEQVSEQDIPPE